MNEIEELFMHKRDGRQQNDFLERMIDKDWRKTLAEHKLQQEEWRKNNKTPSTRGISWYRN